MTEASLLVPSIVLGVLASLAAATLAALAVRRYARIRDMHEASLVEANGKLAAQAAELQSQTAELEVRSSKLRAVAAELRARETRFRALVENAIDLILVIDGAGEVTYASPSVQRVLGYEPAALVGRDVFSLVHPDDLESAVAALRAISARPLATMAGETRARHSDGSWRTLAGHGQNLLVYPGARGVVLNLQDVTALRLTEQRLLQSQKMEAVGRLAGGIAHDFNNLLTSINGYTQFAAHTLGPDHPVHEDLQEVIKAAGVAASLTRQLLAFSRKQVLKPELLDLNHIIEDSANLLRRLLGGDVELHTALAPAVQPVRADPGQIRQVIMNLAVNAREAMPDGGRLRIETRNVVISEEQTARRPDLPPGEYVLMVVSDTGIGMEAEVLERIFEPFFTTREHGSGTGLGLSTTHGIVEQSGGRIWAYSEPGIGTTFRIYLPAAAGAPRPRPRAFQAVAPVAGGTVLIVEDEPSVRAFACRALERAGYRVLSAPDGEQAQQVIAAHAHSISVVVTDVIMPGISGPELARRIGSLHAGIRVLFTSGYPRDEISARGGVPAGVAFVEKPYTASQLVQCVNALACSVPDE